MKSSARSKNHVVILMMNLVVKVSKNRVMTCQDVMSVLIYFPACYCCNPVQNWVNDKGNPPGTKYKSKGLKGEQL